MWALHSKVIMSLHSIVRKFNWSKWLEKSSIRLSFWLKIMRSIFFFFFYKFSSIKCIYKIDMGECISSWHSELFSKIYFKNVKLRIKCWYLLFDFVWILSWKLSLKLSWKTVWVLLFALPHCSDLFLLIKRKEI